MPYNKQNLARVTDAMNTNTGVLAATDNGSIQVFTYRSTIDALATISAANYFSNEVVNIRKGDVILAQASDSFAALHVDASNTNAKTISVVAGTWTAAVAIP